MIGYQLKTDANQLAISEAFKSLGCTVFDLSRVGFGMPDLIVGFCGINLLIEAKSAQGKLTPNQIEFHDAWRGHKTIIRSPNEAIELVIQTRRRIGNQFKRYQEAEGIRRNTGKIINKTAKKAKP